MQPSDFVPPNIAELKAYQPGKPIDELKRELGLDDIIKVASNENPMGPSPLAIEAGRRALVDSHAYPDGGCYELRAKLAERLDVAADELVFGAGSNELLYLLIRTFCQPGRDQVLSHQYAFITYKLACKSHNVEFVEAGTTDMLGCDIDDLLAKITDRTRLILLANPNNPTGAHLTAPQIEAVLAAAPAHTIVVFDEAYHEYAKANGTDYADSQGYRNADKPYVVTLRTFSKIYGLAGLRVGYGICDRRIAGYIERVRRPFNVNHVAQSAALAALDDDAHVDKSCRLARDGIAVISQAARDLGLKPYPSLANFVLIDIRKPGIIDNGQQVYERLLRQGVIVRPMAGWGLPQCVRVSVGTTDENQRSIAALQEIFG